MYYPHTKQKKAARLYKYQIKQMLMSEILLTLKRHFIMMRWLAQQEVIIILNVCTSIIASKYIK